MGARFLAFTLKDFHDLTFGWRDNAYGSIFYLIVGLHAMHVFVGLCMNVLVQIKAWQGKFSAQRHTSVEVFVALLALRRRGVDLRVPVAVLVGGVAMSTAEVERIETASALRRGVEVWYAAFGGIAAWMVHLVFVVSAEHWTHLHPRYGWTLHAATAVCAAGDDRRVAARAAAVRHRVGQRSRVERRRRSVAVPRAARPARRRDQSGADPARGQLRAVHSPWLTSCSRPGPCVASPAALLVVVAAGARVRAGPRPLESLRTGRPMVGVAATARFFAGLATVAVALASPLDAAADTSLSAHMVQHVLLLVGRRAAARARACRSRRCCGRFPTRWRRRATARHAAPARTHTIGTSSVWVSAALVVEAVVMWCWHIPVAYQAAIREPGTARVRARELPARSQRSRGGRSRPVAAAAAARPRSPRCSVPFPASVLGRRDGARAAPVVPDLRHGTVRRPRSPTSSSRASSCGRSAAWPR